MADETYIGDGLYISFDHDMICLRAPRAEGDHFVYLDIRTYDLLIEFAARNGWVLKDKKKT